MRTRQHWIFKLVPLVHLLKILDEFKSQLVRPQGQRSSACDNSRKSLRIFKFMPSMHLLVGRGVALAAFNIFFFILLPCSLFDYACIFHIPRMHQAILLMQNGCRHCRVCLFSLIYRFSAESLIFVKWNEGHWCRARVVEVLQKGSLEPVKTCAVTQLASIRVFFLDHGLTKSITINRYTHTHCSKRRTPIPPRNWDIVEDYFDSVCCSFLFHQRGGA